MRLKPSATDFTWNLISNKNVDSLKADLNLNYGKTLQALGEQESGKRKKKKRKTTLTNVNKERR